MKLMTKLKILGLILFGLILGFDYYKNTPNSTIEVVSTNIKNAIPALNTTGDPIPINEIEGVNSITSKIKDLFSSESIDQAKKDIDKIANDISSTVKTVESAVETASSVSNDITQTTANVGQTISQIKSNIFDKTPSEELSRSILTENVLAQLGTHNLHYNNGSFIIDDGLTDLNASVNSMPYVSLTSKQVGEVEVPTVANALLKRSSRQYKNRKDTGNESTSWTPAGWHQVSNLDGQYKYAVNRGHLIAYAIAGSIKKFDASESNPKNIATQTSWANQANNDTSKGQNYYEGIVRKALDKNKTIRYRVTPIYATEFDLVPVGNRIEARSSDDSVNYDVFIPNVQNGLNINYTTGEITIYQP